VRFGAGPPPVFRWPFRQLSFRLAAAPQTRASAGGRVGATAAVYSAAILGACVRWRGAASAHDET